MFLSGLLFALGLGISGMTQPAKIVGFLDFTGHWDPSLLGVMGGAVMVNLVLYRLILKRSSPLFAPKFSLPTRRGLDGRLLAGAALFGAGWGLGGFCPGPALVSSATATTSIVTFLGAMVAGMYLFEAFEGLQARRRSQPKATLTPSPALPARDR
jgi:hypothetical protein